MWPAALWGMTEVARSNRKVGQHWARCNHLGGLLPFPQNTMSFQETAAVAHVGRCVMSCPTFVTRRGNIYYPIKEHVNSQKID